MDLVIFGSSFIAVPILFNTFFALLAHRFNYPEVLREPAQVVLTKFHSGGTSLVLMWWSFMLTAVAFIPLSISIPHIFQLGDSSYSPLIFGFGLVAGLVQVIGLSRWAFVVPYLARESAKNDPQLNPTIELIFNLCNRLFGIAIGEHLGYFFTGAWSISVGLAFVNNGSINIYLGVAGIVSGMFLLLCSLEFVGKFEQAGWSVAAKITPFTYIAWSIWLVAIGTNLLWRSN